MSKRKVLVVDDDQDVVAFLTALFQDHGFDTVVALDGAEAFQKAGEEQPDLITLDMSMPNQSGVRTFRDLKAHEQLKAIPVVIVTGIGDPMQNFLSRMRNAPQPEGFIAKPIDAQELLRIAERLTRSS